MEYLTVKEIGVQVGGSPAEWLMSIVLKEEFQGLLRRVIYG